MFGRLFFMTQFGQQLSQTLVGFHEPRIYGERCFVMLPRVRQIARFEKQIAEIHIAMG